MINPLDTKYSQLIDQLTKFNEKLDTFINGDEDETVVVNSGTIKSLSGTIKDLNRFRYVQKVINHRLYADMIAADINIEDGMLIRIWGDTILINGIYKKDSTNVYTKIIYSDLYDLKGFLPNPWNYDHISKLASEFSNKISLFTIKIPASEIDSSSFSFTGDLNATIDDVGLRGVFDLSFKIVLVAGGVSDAKGIIKSLDATKVAVDTNFSTLTVPVLTYDVVSTSLEHKYTFYIDTFFDGINRVPARLEFKVNSVDPSIFKKI